MISQWDVEARASDIWIHLYLAEAALDICRSIGITNGFVEINKSPHFVAESFAKLFTTLDDSEIEKKKSLQVGRISMQGGDGFCHLQGFVLPGLAHRLLVDDCLEPHTWRPFALEFESR